MTTSIATGVAKTMTYRIPVEAKSGRFLLGAVPAGVVTIGLFLGMRAVVEVDNVQPDPPPSHTLDAYAFTIAGPAEPPIHEVRKLPEVPPPPRLEPVTIENFDVDAIPIFFTSVQTLPRELAKPIKLEWSNPAVNERNATPIQPPIVNYPHGAETRGLEGDCEVTFDVSPRGRPFNVIAVCSHQIFSREAVRAVSKVEFMPKIWHGQPATRTGVVYPLEFRISE